MPPPECLRKFLCCLANDDDAPSQSLLSHQGPEGAAVAPPLLAEQQPDGVETPASAAGEPRSCAHLEMDDAMSRPPADGPIEERTVSAARGAEPRRAQPARSDHLRPPPEAAASTTPPPAVDAADVFLSASPTIDSVEAYMRRVGAAADEASELDLRGLNTETCAICCAEIILGPQHAIAEMSIPPGERPPTSSAAALHADCFAVYTLSSGSACPVCKLERSSAPPPDDDDDEVRRAAAAAEYADEYADEYGGGEEGEGEGEDDEDWEEREERMLAAREERDLLAALQLSLAEAHEAGGGADDDER